MKNPDEVEFTSTFIPVIKFPAYFVAFLESLFSRRSASGSFAIAFNSLIQSFRGINFSIKREREICNTREQTKINE